jgi:hypothetical protein
MAILSGKDGTIKLAGQVVTPVTHWSLAISCEVGTYVANDTGGAKKRVRGPDDCTGSFVCRATDDGHCPVAAGLQAIVQFHVDDTARNYYEVPILVYRIRVECDIATGEVMAYTVFFAGDGRVVRRGVVGDGNEE